MAEPDLRQSAIRLVNGLIRLLDVAALMAESQLETELEKRPELFARVKERYPSEAYTITIDKDKLEKHRVSFENLKQKLLPLKI